MDYRTTGVTVTRCPAGLAAENYGNDGATPSVTLPRPAISWFLSLSPLRIGHEQARYVTASPSGSPGDRNRGILRVPRYAAVEQGFPSRVLSSAPTVLEKGGQCGLACHRDVGLPYSHQLGNHFRSPEQPSAALLCGIDTVLHRKLSRLNDVFHV